MLDSVLLFLGIIEDAKANGAWVDVKPITAHAQEFDRHYMFGRNPDDHDDPIYEAYNSTISINAKLRVSNYLSLGREDIGVFGSHKQDTYYYYYHFDEGYYKYIGVYYFMNDRAYAISLPWIPSTDHLQYAAPTEPEELKMFNLCFTEHEMAGEKGIRLYVLDVACAHINAGTIAIRNGNIAEARKHYNSAATAVKMFTYVISKLSDENQARCAPVISTFTAKIDSLHGKLKWHETQSLTLPTNSGSPQVK